MTLAELMGHRDATMVSEWHRDHQIVYAKADLLKVAGRVPAGVAL